MTIPEVAFRVDVARNRLCCNHGTTITVFIVVDVIVLNKQLITGTIKAFRL